VWKPLSGKLLNFSITSTLRLSCVLYPENYDQSAGACYLSRGSPPADMSKLRLQVLVFALQDAGKGLHIKSGKKPGIYLL
jgi:hypothetical protein